MQLTAHLEQLAKQPTGYANKEVIGWTERSICCTTTRLVRAGRVFTLASMGGKAEKRYFDTRERADAYYATPQPTVLRKSGSANRLAPPTRGGPARMPGEPIITPQTRITYGKAPAERVYHTNTHGGAA
jgi:hypothetical protein